MISVIIPLYNKERQIHATLESVLRQSYSDYEIVVVDDGSTDGSAAAVKSVQDTRLRLIHQENGGVSAARNRGIREARGEYVAFLDADDLWDPDFLKTLQHLAELYPECSVYACNYDFVSPDGTHRPTIIRRLPFTGEHGILSNYFEVASCSHPPVCSISLMVKKEAMQAIGGFPEGIKSGEDLLTWAKLACHYRIAYHKQTLAHFFTEGYETSDIPKREPDSKDRVGRSLRDLLRQHPTPGLRHYLSHWHKMRTSIYMRLGRAIPCCVEACKALSYHPSNYKVIIMAMISWLPPALRQSLLKRI